MHLDLTQKPLSTSNPAGPPEIQCYTGVFQEIRCMHSKPTNVDPYGHIVTHVIFFHVSSGIMFGMTEG